MRSSCQASRAGMYLGCHQGTWMGITQKGSPSCHTGCHRVSDQCCLVKMRNSGLTAPLLTTRAASPFVTVLGKTLRASVHVQKAPHLLAEKGRKERGWLVSPGTRGCQRAPTAGHRCSLGRAGNCRVPVTESVMTSGPDGRVGVPGWADRASFAWKFPPVPGNPFQMFSPTVC